jgi:hypothetical protein
MDILSFGVTVGGIAVNGGAAPNPLQGEIVEVLTQGDTIRPLGKGAFE